MKKIIYLAGILAVFIALVLFFSITARPRSSLVEVNDFGANPGQLRMFLYVPKIVKEKPPILLVLHWCYGSAGDIFSNTKFAALADKHEYIVVYPSVTRSGHCFDVSSAESLKRDGGSDPVSIMSMINYTKQKYRADSNRVFVTGLSSGAMMTNVMLGNYPEIFKAGSVLAGVPFGCLATTDGSQWNNACASGQLIKSPQEWGELVRAAYPGYNGIRPRIQLWHGTDDATISFVNFTEQVKQWTDVHGTGEKPYSTDTTSKGIARTQYKNNDGEVVVEAISLNKVTHDIKYNELEVLKFFGLDDTA